MKIYSQFVKSVKLTILSCTVLCANIPISKASHQRLSADEFTKNCQNIPPEPQLSETGKSYVTLNKQGFDVLNDATAQDNWLIKDLINFAQTLAHETELPMLDVGGAYDGMTRLLLNQGATVIYNDMEEKHLETGIKKIEPEKRKKLYIDKKTFAQTMAFESESLSAVILHRVLHFMKPEDIECGIQQASG